MIKTAAHPTRTVAAATLLAALLSCGAALAAGAPGLEASVDRTEVALGDSFVWTLTIVADVDGGTSQLKLPDFKGFADMGRSSSEQISLSFGTGGRGFLRTKTVRVTLSPNKTGTLEIGAASAVIKGKRYETQRFAITVLPASKAQSQQPQRPQRPVPGPRIPNLWDDDFDIDSMFGGRPQQVGRDDVFLRAGVDKKQAYIGEQMVWVLQLYSRVPLQGLDKLDLPKFDGFWTEDITTPQRITAESRVLGGVQYNVYLLKRKGLFATKPGKLPIEAAAVSVSLGASVFSAGQRVNRQSEAIEVEVKPLPDAGRPAGFSTANVGQFTLRTESSAYTTRLDQPITVRLVVAGTGNVKYLQLPRLDPGPDFKAYDPTVTEKVNTTKNRFSGERQWEYLLIPQRVGKAQIPPVTFSFFDPGAGQYQALESGPIAVEVTPGSGDPAAAFTAKTAQKGATQAGAHPIRYTSELTTMDPDWHRAWFVKLILAFFPLAWFGVAAYARVMAFVRRDTPYAKQRRAHAMAFKRLKAAAAMIAKGDAQAGPFFSELSRVIHEYLAYRLGREATGLTLEQIGEALTAAGVEPSLGERTTRELENCDFARFTPSASRREEMEGALERTRGLLVDLERKG